MTLHSKSRNIREEINFFGNALHDAIEYQNSIFDVVRTVGQVQMLEHNRRYIESIKKKIASLKVDLSDFSKESDNYEQ